CFVRASCSSRMRDSTSSSSSRERALAIIRGAESAPSTISVSALSSCRNSARASSFQNAIFPTAAAKRGLSSRRAALRDGRLPSRQSRYNLDLGHAAVDEELDAVDVACVIRCKEPYGGGDF